MSAQIPGAHALANVKYEIRGELAHRALELEKQGYEITSLNIGNPGLFGFRTPETMRLAMIENLAAAEPYSHQQGIFPAREAVVLQQQERGIYNLSAADVFIGNGVSELIDLSLRALLNPGDEVLLPSPDYPLWSAAVTLNGGKAVYYDCMPEDDFLPQASQIEAAVTDRTRAIVVINPNNPTGAVYPEALLKDIVAIANRNNLLLLSDEIYDRMVYDDARFVPVATLIGDGVCLSYSGLSKIYRACGYRVGWCVLGGNLERLEHVAHSMELLSALRLCSNVPGQWAVQTALGGFQSIDDLVSPGGRLYESRRVVVERSQQSPYLSCSAPAGAMYAFIRLQPDIAAQLDDLTLASELLEKMHILVAPGSSFNTPYKDHFRITTLPDAETLHTVFDRLDELLSSYA